MIEFVSLIVFEVRMRVIQLKNKVYKNSIFTLKFGDVVLSSFKQISQYISGRKNKGSTEGYDIVVREIEQQNRRSKRISRTFLKDQ